MCLFSKLTRPEQGTFIAVDFVNNKTRIGFYEPDPAQNGYCYIRYNGRVAEKIKLDTIVRILDLTRVMKEDMFLQITLRSGEPIFSKIYTTFNYRTKWLLDNEFGRVISLSNISDVAVFE